LVWYARSTLASGVGASGGCGHWPVVLGDAGPEYPDHDDGEQGEEGGEETAVDGAVRAVADVHADHVLEDLADGEEETGSSEVHYVIVSGCSKIEFAASLKLTHWANFTEHAKDQHSFQDEEDHNEDERHELVQGVESVCPVGRARDGILPVVGESKSSVESNVAGADKERSRRAENEANRGNGSIVEYLVADHSVHEQNPKSGHDRCNMNSRETNAHATIEWEPADREDLAYRNDDVAEEEKLHFSVRESQPLFVLVGFVGVLLLTSYRQQLASCWIA